LVVGGRGADEAVWRYERAVARVEATVDQVVADHATVYVGRPAERHVVRPPRPLPGLTWSIDKELVVEFVHRPEARDQRFVHDVAILRALKKRIRSRHVDIVYAETTWDDR